jgi:hypothetical protein
VPDVVEAMPDANTSIANTNANTVAFFVVLRRYNRAVF